MVRYAYSTIAAPLHCASVAGVMCDRGSMNHLNFKVIIEGILGLLLLGFVLKILLISTVGTFLINITGNDEGSVFCSVAISIVITVYIVGIVVSKKSDGLPLWHALIVGGLACAYKLVRPDLDPLPQALVIVFSLLYIISIVGSACVYARSA